MIADTEPESREDLRGQVDAPCYDCLNDDEAVEVARAAFEIVDFEAKDEYLQLLAEHGLRLVDTTPADETRFGTYAEYTYVAPDGLRVQEKRHVGKDRFYASYLNISGPAGATTEFTEGVLSTATRIKRELRALSLVEHADAADDDGRRVHDEHRLIPRERSAEVVARLPEVGE